MAVDLTVPREYKRRAEGALPGRVVKVVLYGSRARGDAHDESDWDLAVFLRGPVTLDECHLLSDVGASVLWDHGAVIQSLPLAESRQSEESALLHAVWADGIPI
ncbi:MAG TPA: nucleotidyltransferase domain-containing protein [Vineibacter sp.]|nr:nucleotidyltransferase domain-containing protein [Vineibacter sp.]